MTGAAGFIVLAAVGGGGGEGLGAVYKSLQCPVPFGCFRMDG